MKRLFNFIILVGFLVLIPITAVKADVLGQQETFTISAEYDYLGRSSINTTLKYISDRANIYVPDDYLAGLSPDSRSRLLTQLQAIAGEFDTRIYPIETQFFGSEPNPGIDNDSRVTLVFTPLINFAGGYYDTTNQLDRSINSASNQREMIYLNATLVFDTNRIHGFLAHEFQHMISYNQKEKIRQVEDDTWLNELRAQYAVDLLGYNEPFSNSDLQRRAQTLIQNPSDSITEWKNLSVDYGQVTLLGNFIAHNFSPQIIAETLNNRDAGINSINTALQKLGYKEKFTDIFVDWMLSNFLNDQNINKQFGYATAGLKSLRVAPTTIFPEIGDSTKLLASGVFRDWEQHWYDLPSLPVGANPVLKITMESPSISSFLISYIVFYGNGETKVFLANPDSTRNTLYINNIGTDVKRIVLMPFTRDRLAGFTSNERTVDLSLRFERVTQSDSGNALLAFVYEDGAAMPSPTPLNSGSVKPADYGLREGDFIRAEGDNDIFIINDYGYKRLVLNPGICLLYGHLGARGCFSAVKVVSSQVRDVFETSYFFSNGETKDGIVYQMQLINDDTARLIKVSDTKDAFVSSFSDFKKVFFINTKEKLSY